jgi:hypothetical protein
MILKLIILRFIRMEIYYGETKCEGRYLSGPRKGERCNNNAYYVLEDLKLCGTHSNKDKKARKQMKKNPKSAENKQAKIKAREELVVNFAKKNNLEKRKGNVICSKLKMMKEPDHIDGYLKVFPNFKHGNRKDGFGCPRLSPKSLGPIVHNQPGLPIALNLENFHQGSKCFECETEEDFYSTQKEMFLDPIPHRHKEAAKDIKGNKNICKYWVWIDQNGVEKHFSYFESRQFYCNYYERLVSQEKDYLKLQEMVNAGTNIQIIGYDAYDINLTPGVTLAEKIENAYKDISRPFGHELVLFSMLTLSEKEYPWRKYKTEDF